MSIRYLIKFIKKNLTFIILPVIPLIEGLFFDPIGRIVVVGDTYPFIQGLLLLLILLHRFFIKRQFNVYSGLMLMLIGFNIFALIDYPLNISYFIVIYLSFLLMNGKDFGTNYHDIKIFILSYSLIAVLIYIFRFNQYSYDILRTRGGVNIYGSNDLICIPLISLSYTLYRNDGNTKDSNIYLFIITLFSFLFVRRINIVMSFILIFSFIIFKYSSLIFSKKGLKIFLTTGSLFLILYFFLRKFNFQEAIFLRFSTSDSNFKSLSSFIEQTSSNRLEIWQTGVNIFKHNQLYGIGLGNTPNYISYSSFHSLFINNMVECGIIIGTLINLVYLLPIFKIIISQIPKSNKILSLLSYFSFIVIANFSGTNLFQNKGYVSGFATLGFFFIIRMVFSKRSEIVNTN